MNYIIVGDIHGNFIKFFEPLHEANIIKSYYISDDESVIKYKFTNEPATHQVIYLGDFIHRGKTSNQMYILDILINICTKYPNDVKFVLGNHEIAECNYYLNIANNDLYQWSTLNDHNKCKECKKYDEIMTKFLDFLSIRNNLLKIEYPDFIVSHTFHYQVIPGNLDNCLDSSKNVCKSVSVIRPKTPRHKLPIYLSSHPGYLGIRTKYKKVNIAHTILNDCGQGVNGHNIRLYPKKYGFEKYLEYLTRHDILKSAYKVSDLLVKVGFFYAVSIKQG